MQIKTLFMCKYVKYEFRTLHGCLIFGAVHLLRNAFQEKAGLRFCNSSKKEIILCETFGTKRGGGV